MTFQISSYLPKELPKFVKYAIKTAENIYQNISSALLYSLNLFYSSMGSVAGILRGRVKDLTPQKALPDQKTVVAEKNIAEVSSTEVIAPKETPAALEMVSSPASDTPVATPPAEVNNTPADTNASDLFSKLIESKELKSGHNVTEIPSVIAPSDLVSKILESMEGKSGQNVTEMPSVIAPNAAVTTLPAEVEVNNTNASPLASELLARSEDKSVPSIEAKQDPIVTPAPLLKSPPEKLVDHFRDVASTAQEKAQNAWEEVPTLQDVTTAAKNMKDLSWDQAIQKMASVAKEILSGSVPYYDPFQPSVPKPE